MAKLRCRVCEILLHDSVFGVCPFIWRSSRSQRFLTLILFHFRQMSNVLDYAGRELILAWMIIEWPRLSVAISKFVTIYAFHVSSMIRHIVAVCTELNALLLFFERKSVAAEKYCAIWQLFNVFSWLVSSERISLILLVLLALQHFCLVDGIDNNNKI